MKESKFIKIRIKKMADWFAMFLIKNGYHANYTIESFEEIDRFLDENINFILEKNNSNYLFALASYIGETLRYTHKAKWQNEENEKTERTIYIKLNNQNVIYPFEIATKRITAVIRIKDALSEIKQKK